MKWLARLRFLLRPFLSRKRVHLDLDDEIGFHLDMEARKLIRAGMTPRMAHREARRRFGGEERVKEEVREVDGVGWMEKLAFDGRHGIRILRKNPVFAWVGIVSLALGIGAATSIFSVVDWILLRPLPYPASGDLVTVWADHSERGGPVREWLSFPDIHDIRGLGVFEAVAAFEEWQPTLAGDGAPRMLRGAQVSEGMFSRVLGVSPALGRGFLPSDEPLSSPAVVVLSHEFWQRSFGGDTEAVGGSLILDGTPMEVVGVMPPGFRAPLPGGDYTAGPPIQDLWTLLRVDSQGPGQERGNIQFRALGRLSPGISLAMARAELLRLGGRLASAFPDTNTGRSFSAFRLQDDMVRGARTGLWVLLGSVVFVLLLVCLNLANLVLARGSSREGEMALRSALGAGRSRLACQLLTESVILAGLGGILGLAFSLFGTDLLVSMAPAGVPRIDQVSVDGRVLAFGILATVSCGLVFGLFPALRLSEVDLRRDLASGGRTASSSAGARLRGFLVATQMAAALILVVGTGLLLRSFQELHRVDLGFEPAGVVSAYFAMDPQRYPEVEDRVGFVREMEDRIRSLPGVSAVGVVSTLPLSGQNSDVDFQVQGQVPPPPGEENVSWIRRITPEYFQAMGIPLIEGRAFTPDDVRADDRAVVIVNETLARRYFPGESAVGRFLNFNNPDEPVWREIVGVARDVKNFGVRAPSQNATYFPYYQVPNTGLFLAVRSSLDDPASLAPAIRRVIGDLDSSIGLDGVSTMEGQVAASLEQEKFVALLLTLFSAVALILAAVGLYGVSAYAVARRAREIGLRAALGADAGAILRSVLGRSLLLAGSGLAVGVVGAVGVTHLMGSLLFGVSPTDPVTFAATVVGLLLLSAGASFLPAWRATRLDPVRVLQAE